MMHVKAIKLHVENAVAIPATEAVMRVTLLFVFLLFGLIQSAAAGEVKLAWDAAVDARVHHYQINTGSASGQYDRQQNTTGTSLTVSELESGKTYYFAARACSQDEKTCSDLSNEIKADIPYVAPVARLSANVVSGIAPLTVNFSDNSTGVVTSRDWSFGDGAASTATAPAHTYTTPGTYPVSLTVKGPGGTSVDSRAAFIEVKYPAPVAAFAATGLAGTAPFNVAFSNSSEGQITTWAWTFGDGATSNLKEPAHLYTTPGQYAVTLTVTGPGGTNSLARANYVEVEAVPEPGPESLPLEIGDVEMDDTWQQVNFQRTFKDPIVVVKALSDNGAQASVIRVKGISKKGFQVRVQEWDYLDGGHATESASYLVMERGRHQLPDGVWVEAGSVQTKATNAFQYQAYGAAFKQAPVVFAAVTSVNEEDAVNARLQQITNKGFYVGMREQQANAQKHVAERVDYIAWEVSKGTVAGLRYEVGRTGNRITSNQYSLTYQSVFEQTPVFVADAQTTNNGDAFSLRWTGLNADGVKLWVQEEQSKDTETTHGTEDVGYFLADIEL